MEEVNIRDSIETFEKEFNKSLGNRSVMNSLEIGGGNLAEESKERRRMNQTNGSAEFNRQ